MRRQFAGRSSIAIIYAFAVLTLFLTARPCDAAQMTYTGQTRTATALASGLSTSDQHTASAPDYGHFSAAVFAIIGSDQPNLPSTGQAEQYSWLLPQQVMFSGRVGGKDNWAGNGVGAGKGTSVLNTTFTLDTSTAYTFDFSLSGSLGNSYGYTFSLAGPGGNVFNEFGFSDPSDGPDYSGTLLPGNYTLNINVTGGGQGSATTGGISNYGVDFSIPEPSAAAMIGGTLCVMAGRRRQARVAC